uniref:Uncharacterized protein n=1 Tax=Ciona intestinalis TaxID=7719 RepID=H2Y2Z6_CIOIN
MPDLYVTSDVQAFAENNKFGADIFNNNFATSFLEQEICCLAKVFLGSPLSSWTQSVMFDRVARGNSQHSSLLEVLFKDSSTLPKLTWYFPEGV